jgi:uncharacterized membrane protein
MSAALSTPRMREHPWAWWLFAIMTSLYAGFGIHRHLRFGSGSWDMGCYIHNSFLFGHLQVFSADARSSVLGDVGFWGGENHFMPTLLLTGPLSWLGSATTTGILLIVVQAALVAACALALTGLGDVLRLPPAVSRCMSMLFVLHIGVQSFVAFDVHELAPMPLLMILAITAAHQAQWRSTWLWMLLLMGCKESAWLVGAGVGSLIWWLPTRRAKLHGTALMMTGMVGFFVVTMVLQPTLRIDGDRMLHVARLQAYGSTMSEVLRYGVTHPFTMLAHMFTPAPKLHTWMVCVVGAGVVGILWPKGWPLLLMVWAERMLPNKPEMWGLSFHYSLVTVAVLSVCGMHALASAACLRQNTLAPQHATKTTQRALAMWVIACVGISWWMAPSTPDLWRFSPPYLSSWDQAARFRRALAVVNDNDAVVAQNYFLPHVAARAHVWQPEQRFVERADVVVLDTQSSSWPHAPAHVRSLVEQLRHNDAWQVAFHEDTTWVFRRKGASR